LERNLDLVVAQQIFKRHKQLLEERLNVHYNQKGSNH